MARKRASSSSSHQENGAASSERRSKQRRVAEPGRKRVAKACLSCRRLKEKCDGSIPCGRCIRYRRTCETSSTAPEPLTSSTASPHGESSERSAYLETIARHFLGEVPMDTRSLKQVVENLKSQPSGSPGQTPSESDTRLSDIATPSPPMENSSRGKLSDVAFTRKLHGEVRERLEQAGIQPDRENPSGQPCSALLLNTNSFRRENLPPKDVAVFLVGLYFDFAQTTTLLVEQPWIDDKIDRVYSSTEPLSPQDLPWLCSVLTVLAVGVRYAHLADAVSHESTDFSQAPMDMGLDRDASLQFYQLAAGLVPNALVLPCADSMQAFVLLAQFALMWNETSQAYGYLGAAIRVGTQIDVQKADHAQGVPLGARQTYERLYQVAHAWDKRMCILCGIPSSNRNDIIDLKKLQLRSADAEQQQISLDASTTLFIQLTDWLGAVAQLLSNLHGHEHTLRAHSLERLMEVRGRYKRWWSDLNISRIPILQLNRWTAPMHLCYHLNLVFIGRSFAFHRIDNGHQTELSIDIQNAIAELVDEAEYSAYEIIDICTMLERSTGLGGVRYIDNSACRAAVCVMLAQSLVGRCHLFRGKMQEGMKLVRKMAQIAPAYNAGLSTIETISDEIEKLAPHRRNQKYKSTLSYPVNAESAYRSLQDWARVGSKSLNADLADLDVLIRGDGNERSELEDVFDCNLLDSSLFTFDSTGFNEFGQGCDVY